MSDVGTSTTWIRSLSSCKLHKNTVRIANVYLIRRVQTLRRNSVLLEFFPHSIRLIPFHRDTEVIHANRVHAVGDQSEYSHPQREGSACPLAIERRPKERLVELPGSVQIGDLERNVIQPYRPEQRLHRRLWPLLQFGLQIPVVLRDQLDFDPVEVPELDSDAVRCLLGIHRLLLQCGKCGIVVEISQTDTEMINPNRGCSWN